MSWFSRVSAIHPQPVSPRPRPRPPCSASVFVFQLIGRASAANVKILPFADGPLCFLWQHKPRRYESFINANDHCSQLRPRLFTLGYLWRIKATVSRFDLLFWFVRCTRGRLGGGPYLFRCQNIIKFLTKLSPCPL